MGLVSTHWGSASMRPQAPRMVWASGTSILTASSMTPLTCCATALASSSSGAGLSSARRSHACGLPKHQHLCLKTGHHSIFIIIHWFLPIKYLYFFIPYQRYCFRSLNKRSEIWLKDFDLIKRSLIKRSFGDGHGCPAPGGPTLAGCLNMNIYQTLNQRLNPRQ